MQTSFLHSQLGSFLRADASVNLADPVARFRPLAINADQISQIEFDQTAHVIPQLVYHEELLYGTNQLYETDNGESPFDSSLNSTSAHWDLVSRVLATGNDHISAIALTQSSGDGFYVGTEGGLVFVDLNDGAQGFPLRNNGLPGLNNIAVDPHNPLVAYVMLDGFNTKTGHLFKTVNGGLNWTRADTGLADAPAYAMAIDPRPLPGGPAGTSGRIYVGTERGVFFSDDTGATWNRLGTGLPTAPVFDVSFNADLNLLAVATLGFGAYEISTDLVGPSVVAINAYNPNNDPPAPVEHAPSNQVNFSISNGIVSRTPGNDVLQVSAPVSPGNSGGPVYDEFGNLLGVVTSKVARSAEPEAENLNFAVSTDALLHEADWEMVGVATAKNEFTDFVHKARVRRGPGENVSEKAARDKDKNGAQ